MSVSEVIVAGLRIVLGLSFSLFIPGYLLTLIFFKELDQLEKIGLGMVLSICVDIALGLFLGYNETMKNLTGGITAENVWTWLVGITIGLVIVLYALPWIKRYEFVKPEEGKKGS